MVTRQPPRLDVLIRAQLTVNEAGDVTYRFGKRITNSMFNTSGAWQLDTDGTLLLDSDDSADTLLPTLIAELPLAGASIAFGTGAAAVITITSWEAVLPFGGPDNFTAYQVGYTGALPDPGAAQTLTLTLPLGAMTERTEERIVWAGRRDFTADDVIKVSNTGAFEISDVRFITRAGAWAVGDTFIDDQGVERTVRGVSHLDRGRFLELLTRAIT